jgi:threonine aldolase
MISESKGLGDTIAKITRFFGIDTLAKKIAKLFGKEESLLVPSGTMSNLIGMMLNVKLKGEGAIVGHLSHVYNIERGGMSALGGIHPIVV